MSTRFLRALSASLGVLLIISGVDSPSGGSSNSTGNTAAIALYSRAVTTTNALPVLEDTSTNYFFLQDNSSTLSTSGFHLQRGVPRAPAGFVDARVIQTYRIVGTKEKWILTKIVPDCGATSACRHTVGLEFFDAPTSEKVAYLTGPTTKYCWAQSFAPSNSYFGATIGLSVWNVSGKFFPVKHHADQTIFTSQYSSGGQPVTETDWVATSTDRFVRSVYQGSAIGQYPAYSFSVVETDPTSIPLAPNFPTCAS